MAWRKVKLPATLENTPIVIHYNAEFAEYRVRITGKPQADYFTSDKSDAFSTGQAMRNEELAFSRIRKNPAPKRKTAARTMKAAVGYVNRPSQITKKAPTKRLKKRRTVNLQSPRGVFPNPAKRAPKYPGSMDVAYPTLTAFKKDAKGAGYDADELLMSGQYFVESDGHVLSAKFAPSRVKKNPVPRKVDEILVQQSLDRKRWTTFARFPDTEKGKVDALEYASAYAKKEPYLYIQVTK